MNNKKKYNRFISRYDHDKKFREKVLKKVNKGIKLVELRKSFNETGDI